MTDPSTPMREEFEAWAATFCLTHNSRTINCTPRTEELITQFDAIWQAATVKERERACKAICSICRGEENSYEATPEVRFVSEAIYVSNYGSIEAGWAHIGGNVEYVPCKAAAIRSDSKGEKC